MNGTKGTQRTPEGAGEKIKPLRWQGRGGFILVFGPRTGWGRGGERGGTGGKARATRSARAVFGTSYTSTNACDGGAAGRFAQAVGAGWAAPLAGGGALREAELVAAAPPDAARAVDREAAHGRDVSGPGGPWRAVELVQRGAGQQEEFAGGRVLEGAEDHGAALMLARFKGAHQQGAREQQRRHALNARKEPAPKGRGGAGRGNALAGPRGAPGPRSRARSYCL